MKNNLNNFDTYIKRLGKTIRDDSSITRESLQVINTMIDFVIKKLSNSIRELMANSKHVIITSRDLQTAVRLVIDGDLAKHAVSEGTKVVTRFYSGGHTFSQKRLVFPTGRVEKHFRQYLDALCKVRLGTCFKHYAAGVIEHLTGEILELAGNWANDVKKRRITPKHINLAVRDDEDLNKLFKNGRRVMNSFPLGIGKGELFSG